MGDDRNGPVSLVEMLAFAEEDGEIEEVRALCADEQSPTFSEEEIAQLAAERVGLRAEQRRLALSCQSGSLSREGYLDAISLAIADFAHRSAAIVGRERFDALFGDAAMNPEGLIDREQFLSSDGGKPHFRFAR